MRSSIELTRTTQKINREEVSNSWLKIHLPRHGAITAIDTVTSIVSSAVPGTVTARMSSAITRRSNVSSNAVCQRSVLLRLWPDSAELPQPAQVVIAWYWGLVNALLVAFVIWANGRAYRWGWLAGASAQAWIIAFGLAHGSWPFVFSVIPLMMFLRNWRWHTVRQARLRAEHYEDFAREVLNHVEAATPDDVIDQSAS